MRSIHSLSTWQHCGGVALHYSTSWVQWWKLLDGRTQGVKRSFAYSAMYHANV
jgi:hypothetical protein